MTSSVTNSVEERNNDLYLNVDCDGETFPIAIYQALSPIIWKGKTWAVTEYGIERLDGRYWVPVMRLIQGYRSGGRSLPEDIAEKGAEFEADFSEVWQQALGPRGFGLIDTPKGQAWIACSVAKAAEIAREIAVYQRNFQRYKAVRGGGKFAMFCPSELAALSSTEEMTEAELTALAAEKRECEAAAAAQRAKEAGWPEPFDVFGDGSLTPKPVLTRDMLPEAIAAFAFDQAELKGVEPAMVAIPALVACAGACTDRIKLQPREFDDLWREPARLWAAMIAPPGGRKTPAQNAAIDPLKEIEGRWWREDRDTAALYEAKLADYKLKAKVMASIGSEIEPPKEPPPRRRATVGDTTMEKLAEILADNPDGVLAVYDELAGFIGGFDAYRANGAGKDRTAALELWNGGPRTVDRKNGSTYVPNWSASVLGSIQPNKLREMTTKARLGDDGLLQRFLVFTGQTLGRGVDRKPDQAAQAGYAAIMRSLTYSRRNKGERTLVVTLSKAARPYWEEIDALADAMTRLPTISPALATWLAKVPGNFARLLLTFHMIETIKGEPDAAKVKLEIGEDTARRARNLMVQFFIPHAVRVYGAYFGGVESEGEVLRRLARFLLAHGKPAIKGRDLNRLGPTDLRGQENEYLRRGAMVTLAECGWVEQEIGADEWKVNPLVYERFATIQAAEQERRATVRAKIEADLATVRATYGEGEE